MCDHQDPNSTSLTEYHGWSQTESKVFCLQALGVIDAQANDLENSELMAHAMANTATSTHADFAVKRGSSFVNEYGRRDQLGNLTAGTSDDANHLLGAFPCLFPYGMGGFEVSRPIPLSYAEHAKWSLRYADRRFRKDHGFIFQLFGVIQKRQVCSSSCLQVSKKAFHDNEAKFRSVRPIDLEKASQEEARKVPVSNPTILSLKHHISTVRTKVMGTDESRMNLRSHIWGMTVMSGPPSLWITINPTDTHDPVAQVFAGQDINLDEFDDTAGPDTHSRACIIAGDPYAASKFFHFTVQVILEELFGIQGHRDHTSHIKRQEGIYGTVQGYIGTVEAQGRGTLHLHILLWLLGSPTAAHMKELLSSDSFRARVTQYIADNIHGHVQGTSSQEFDIPSRNGALSYSRPIEPSAANYTHLASRMEFLLAKNVQKHKCGFACLKVIKGRIMCKRRAPFPVSAKDWIDIEGKWGPRRLHPFLNNWNPTTLLCTRSNNDVKLITNGGETKEYGWYITSYTAKKQHNTSNASALLAKAIAFHQKQERYTADIDLLNKRLIQRCANTLSREQEFSAPEVISYLMGWGDRYVSHQTETIYFSSVISLLKRQFPALKNQKLVLISIWMHIK